MSVEMDEPEPDSKFSMGKEVLRLGQTSQMTRLLKPVARNFVHSLGHFPQKNVTLVDVTPGQLVRYDGIPPFSNPVSSVVGVDGFS